MWQFWLIAAGIFFIVEMATVGFLVFWFGIGSLITMICSFFISDIYIQTLIFLVTSTLLLFLTKPFVNKFVTKKEKNVVTNAYSVVGKTGIVTQEINSIQGTGQVKVSGEVWSAKTAGNEIITKDSEVKIEKIDGVKVIVSLVKSPQNV